MKKLLLIISALFVVFGVKAQDVYLSGTAMDVNENLIAVVYRNGELLYQGQSVDERFGYGVVVNPYDHDDVFWLEEYYEAGDRVSLIHRGNGNYLAIYDAVVGKMFWCNSGDNNSDNDLLSVGYRDGSDNNHYAAVWRSQAHRESLWFIMAAAVKMQAVSMSKPRCGETTPCFIRSPSQASAAS